MAITVPAPIAKQQQQQHLLVYVGIAIAALALVASVLIGMAVADSGSGTTFPVTSSGVHQELPTRFGENRPAPDAVEHPSVAEPARYGSPDAAEEWNR